MEAKLKNRLKYVGMAGVVAFLLMLFLDAPIQATVIVLVLAYSVVTVATDASVPLKAANLILALFVLVGVLAM